MWSKSLKFYGESQVNILRTSTSVLHDGLRHKLFCNGCSVQIYLPRFPSSFYPVNAAVAQGSVLTPTMLLLNITINFL